MLGEQQQCGFLDAVGKRLNRSVGKEWFYLDCVLYRKAPQFIGYGVYPAGYDVIIEHENGEQIEQEMWKQLMWRSPLKVLIFYDYLDDERKNDQMARWRDSKIATIADNRRAGTEMVARERRQRVPAHRWKRAHPWGPATMAALPLVLCPDP